VRPLISPYSVYDWIDAPDAPASPAHNRNLYFVSFFVELTRARNAPSWKRKFSSFSAQSGKVSWDQEEKVELAVKGNFEWKSEIPGRVPGAEGGRSNCD